MNPKITAATIKNPKRSGFVSFIHSPEGILPSPISRQTSALSAFQLMCSAGWGDRNITPRFREPVDIAPHAQTSRPGCGRNISASPSQKLSDPGKRSRSVPGFADRVRGKADSYLTPLESAYCLEERSAPRRQDTSL